MKNNSLLSDLIDLYQALQSDRNSDLGERKQRDRAVGLTLQNIRNKPAAQISAWLHQVFPAAPDSAGHQGARLYHLLSLCLLIIGFISGWGLTSIVLFYDGSQPINIVNALVVLILPQIFLLLIWIVTVMPLHLQLFSNIGAMLGFLNPGRVAARITDYFSVKGNKGLDMLWDPDNTAVLSPVGRWLFSFWSQLFAFSFNIGILVKAFLLVSFSDLAFAWSTTLQISNAGFHQFLLILSAPWSSIIADAMPTADLVANSRYYRLDSGTPAAPDLAITLGQWWPFLVAAVCCYGLLPRMVTLTVSWYRFRHYMRNAMHNLPGAPELLARMNSPLVSTMATGPEHALSIDTQATVVQQDSIDYALRCPVINWSGAAQDDAIIGAMFARLGIEAQEYYHAGGRQSIEQDQELQRLLCTRKPDAMAILVKAWEPPMLEFVDFVRGIRRQCGQQKPIIVLLSGGGDNISKTDRETWHVMLAQLGDPNLHIETEGSVS